MPRYAVFEVGEDNSYGHPYSEIVERYENIGAEILRTDELDTIVLETDGYSLTDVSNYAKETTEIAPSDNTEIESSTEDAKYILNINSKKIHLSDCPSASNISPQNKKTTNETIEELEKQGYTCCKSCNPKG